MSKLVLLFVSLLTASFITASDRPFVCPYFGCNNSYTVKSHLNVHKRKHTGEKPYRCTVHGCKEKFSRSDELTRHTRRHTGVRPFTCNVCSKTFARPDHLTTHMNYHSGVKPFKCLIKGCKASFFRKCDLKRHEKAITLHLDNKKAPVATKIVGETKIITNKDIATAEALLVLGQQANKLKEE